ncbi:alpha-amylase family glycosyl hydrolase [Clostridium cibarium]|nr:alpha-amylase family glycosyl hydrolase [Clostridium cibarium]
MKGIVKKFPIVVLVFAILITTIFDSNFVIRNKVFAGTNEVNIYVEKPEDWENIWIWYDSDLSTSKWDTSELSKSPGELEEYRTGWYKKTLNSKDVQFLFNNGTWSKKLSNSGNDFRTQKDIWIKKDGSVSFIDPLTTDNVKTSVKVHFKSTWGQSKIYYWNASPGSLKSGWPGDEMSSEGNDWYGYELKGVDSTNLIFNNGKNQTADLSRTKGEWWYKDNNWYESNPEVDPNPDPKPDPKPDPGPGPKPNPDSDNRTDFRDETIYFVMTSRFYDGDKSNNTHCWDDGKAGNPDSDPAWRGDFKGLIEKLDYIKALGFTAIWISPVVENASGYDYHGYHAINFSKVDSRYESDGASYQDLINSAHSKGMKVIQDIVLNHTSNFGEENLFPLFAKNKLLKDTASNLKKLDIDKKLPSNYDSLNPDQQYQARISAMKEDKNDTNNIYHHEKSLDWEGYTVQTGQIAGDCVDLNTENPIVSKYLIDSYDKYIDMGVDAFRIDTAKHISRLTLNKEFIPAFKERGGDNFFMFGEIATRYRQVWNNNIPAVSTPFYTWKESKEYSWTTNFKDRMNSTLQNWNDNKQVSNQPTSDNHLLNGNTYHTPNNNIRSGLDVIDFPMHWNFNNAHDAYNTALDGDKWYSDATWNVTYVDSHDYAPDGAPENQRFAGSQDTWAENLNLMFTFRGIPTIYYGSEIEFMKGAPIDVGPNAPLSKTGRAYYGDKIEGDVKVDDFAQYSSATGAMKDTLNYPLAKHIQRLNLLRRKIPALRKGEYSIDGVNGSMAFKRRYTNNSQGIDSFALVSITDGATFNNIPNGRYVDAITGETKNVTNGTLVTPSVGKGNMRVFVLDLENNGAPGKVGENGSYLK